MYILAILLTLLTPLFMLSVGIYWKVKPPVNRDSLLSYRTELSMKNDETLQFAHTHISRLWIRVSLILAVLTMILMVVFSDKYTSFILWILIGQMVFLCGTVLFVDSLMKAIFDSDGNSTV